MKRVFYSSSRVFYSRTPPVFSILGNSYNVPACLDVKCARHAALSNSYSQKIIALITEIRSTARGTRMLNHSTHGSVGALSDSVRFVLRTIGANPVPRRALVSIVAWPCWLRTKPSHKLARFRTRFCSPLFWKSQPERLALP